MSNTASLKKEYAERIAPALKNQFQYSSSMQIPVLKKIVINQGLGMAVADKKIIDVRPLLLYLAKISLTSSCVRKCRSV